MDEIFLLRVTLIIFQLSVASDFPDMDMQMIGKGPGSFLLYNCALKINDKCMLVFSPSICNHLDTKSSPILIHISTVEVI